MKYHLTQVRIAIMNKSTNNKFWQGCGEKGKLFQCWWKCRLVQPLWKTIWSYLKELKIEQPFDPVIPLLGICPKEHKTLIGKNVSNPMFIAALFIIAKIWKKPKCPSVDKCIKQLWDIYTMEYYSAVKKKILPLVATLMDLDTIMLSEISQSEKDKYYMVSLICGI